MVLTFQIDKLQAGAYQAAVLGGNIEVTPSSEVYPTIADAIRREAAAVPVGFAHFGEVHYGGASSGTIGLATLSAKANEVADQLVAIVAEMHRLAEA